MSNQLEQALLDKVTLVEILQLGDRVSVVAFADHTSQAVSNDRLYYTPKPYVDFQDYSRRSKALAMADLK